MTRSKNLIFVFLGGIILTLSLLLAYPVGSATILSNQTINQNHVDFSFNISAHANIVNVTVYLNGKEVYFNKTIHQNKGSYNFSGDYSNGNYNLIVSAITTPNWQTNYTSNFTIDVPLVQGPEPMYYPLAVGGSYPAIIFPEHWKSCMQLKWMRHFNPFEYSTWMLTNYNQTWNHCGERL